MFDFFGPILGLRLIDLGLNENEVGLFFCILPPIYIVSCVVVAYFPKRIDKKVIIITGLLAAFPTLLLNGPS